MLNGDDNTFISMKFKVLLIAFNYVNDLWDEGYFTDHVMGSNAVLSWVDVNFSLSFSQVFEYY